MPFANGTRIGAYRIEQWIKSASYVNYYRVTDQASEKYILVTYFEGKETSDAFKAEFQSIANHLAKLNHPSVLRVEGFGFAEQIAYLVYERNNFITLEEYATQPLPVKETAKLLAQVVAGLEYLHAQDVHHGNLSISTVLINPDFSIKIFDYGMYALLSRELSWSVPDSMILLGIEKLPYKPPELVAGKDPGVQTDVFSLGAIYFRLITHLDPFQSATALESGLRKGDLPIGWPRKLPPKINDTVLRLIHRCTAAKPAHRFAAYGELKAILTKLSLGKRARFRCDKGALRYVPPKPPYLRVFLLGLLFLIGVGGLGYYLTVYVPVQQKVVQDRAATQIASIPTITPTATLTITPSVTPSPTATATVTSTVTPTSTPKPTFQATLNPDNIDKIQRIGKAEVYSYLQSASMPVGVIANRAQSLLEFSPDGKILAASSVPYRTVILNGTTLEYQASVDGRMPPGYPFSPDGNQLLTLQYAVTKMRNGDTISAEYLHLWLAPAFTSHDNLGVFVENASVMFVPAGNILVASRDNLSKAWDVGSRLDIEISEGGEFGCQIVRAKHDREFLSAFSPVGMIDHWDDLAQYVCTYSNRPKVAASKDLKHLAYVNDNGLVELYNTETRKILWRVLVPVTTLAFSNDGSITLGGQKDGTLLIWDTQTGAIKANIQTGLKSIAAIRVSPDNKYIAVMDDFPQVSLFALNTTD